MPDMKGRLGATGDVHLVLNPPPPEPEGARVTGAWVRVELVDDGTFTVRLFGQAHYVAPDGGGTREAPTMHERSLTHHIDLDDPGLAPLKVALQSVLDAYGPAISQQTLEAAYLARRQAMAHDVPPRKE